MDRNLYLSSFALVLAFVALRKESVDRNDTMQVEIVKMYAVALRKESVDRNKKLKMMKCILKSRSPQGERG